MKIRPTLTLLLALSTLSFGQKKTTRNCLIAYHESVAGNILKGYKSLNGNVVIKAKYQYASDTFCTMAIILNARHEFVGIDRNEREILKVYIYDNGPDEVEEGLFRYIENGKIGFADLDGRKIIGATYDFANPFSEGITEYFIGGERIYENGKTGRQIIQESGKDALRDKYWTWGGNIKERGYLNRYGQKFKKVTELQNNRRQAWTRDNKHFLLNQRGRIIKTYTK